jgi:hypothetical protein
MTGIVGEGTALTTNDEYPNEKISMQSNAKHFTWQTIPFERRKI